VGVVEADVNTSSSPRSRQVPGGPVLLEPVEAEAPGEEDASRWAPSPEVRAVPGFGAATRQNSGPPPAAAVPGFGSAIQRQPSNPAAAAPGPAAGAGVEERLRAMEQLVHGLQVARGSAALASQT
jgi:hypothetical protein